MNSIKRVEKRLKKNLLVYRDNGGFELIGMSANISKNGLYIESPYIISSDQEISLAIAINDEFFEVKGLVRWVKKPDDRYPEHIPAGMGIRITEAPEEYINFVEYARYE